MVPCRIGFISARIGCHIELRELAMSSKVRSVEKQIFRIAVCVMALLLFEHTPARSQSYDDQKQIPPGHDKQLQAEPTASPTAGPESVFDTTHSDANPLKTAASSAGGSSADASAAPQTTSDNGKANGYLDVYGFVELDLGYNFRTIDPNWYDVMRPSKLPAFSGEFGKNGSTFFSVRPSRFGTKGMYPTPWGDMTFVFEFDMFGVGPDAGQTTIRPRKYYGEIGRVLAGQTNTNFMDIDVFPNILDYWGPNGMVFIRQPQLRWTPINEDTTLAIAIEQPGASADSGALADRIDLSNVKGRFQWPDLTGSIKYSWGKSYIRGAGVVRSIKIDNLVTNNTQSIVGWGFNASSNVAFYKDVLRLQYVIGDGIENYMNDAPIDVAPELNPSNPAMPIKGQPVRLQSFVTYLDHNWSDKWSSAIGYSSLWMTNTSLQTPDAFHQGQYASVNLLCSPFKHFMTGGEFQYGRRTNMSNGYHANDYKVQFSFKYSWDFRVLGRS
jgi:DcaP outer membrane protein